MHPKNPEAVDSKSASPQEQYPEGQWTTGLYDCCDDNSNCLTTCFCPCVTFGRIAEIIDNGDRSCGLSGLVYYAMGSIGSMEVTTEPNYDNSFHSRKFLMEIGLFIVVAAFALSLKSTESSRTAVSIPP
ncbi:hypothetical protein REPUB_Repub04eG0260800 [Reevesia pubescens]